jgi:DNA modification methylase
MLKRIRWRYAKGRPYLNGSHIYLGDCSYVLNKVYKHLLNSGMLPIRLVFTSPPYFGVTNYHYDQWIRLWMLGYPPAPNSSLGKHRERFQIQDEYKSLLKTTFRKVSYLTDKQSVIYVRTDSRKFTLILRMMSSNKFFPTKK